jgi:putative sugar O-methyltransferase
MLNYFHGLVFLEQTLGKTEIQSFLEIGGGFGTLGEILHKAGGRYSYVDVDIPPVSAVASYYLAQIPELQFIDYARSREAEKLTVPHPGQQMVICPWQLSKLEGTIDLLWNFISFQEMEPDVVKFYLNQGKRLGVRYVLLGNLREGKQRMSAESRPE